MSKKVLVVDDEHEVVSFLEDFLRRFDLEVVSVTDASQALSDFKTHNPDFVFLDIQMPEKNGIEILRELKSFDPQVKVIMITARHDEEYQVQAKQLGAIDYITKPLDLGDLSKKIKKYILRR